MQSQRDKKREKSFFESLRAHVPEQGQLEDDSGSDSEIDDTDDEDYEPTESDEEWQREHVVSGDAEWEEKWCRSACPCEICTGANTAVDQWVHMRNVPAPSPIAEAVCKAADAATDSIRTTIDNVFFDKGWVGPRM